jgi:hypothetical protein
VKLFQILFLHPSLVSASWIVSLLHEMKQPMMQRPEACKAQWTQTCYTSFVILEFLLQVAGVDLREFVASPKLPKDKLEKLIMAATDDQLKPLWNNGTGLCTSWCVLISSKVYPDFNNNLGDQGKHRAAFSAQGIIIESSAYDAMRAEKDNEAVATEQSKSRWHMTGAILGRLMSSNIRN